MDVMKTALINAMEKYFNGDKKRINHANRVTVYAEELLEHEEGDYTVVVGASVLHDIGIHEAEKKYGSTAGKYQEREGPPIARRIMTELQFTQDRIDEICDIIAHHHSPGKITTRNFGIVYDADWLVNLQDEYDIHDTNKLANIIEKVFLTESGKSLARRVYLQGVD
jgi:HD superfamily phosphodiesterase